MKSYVRNLLLRRALIGRYEKILNPKKRHKSPLKFLMWLGSS